LIEKTAPITLATLPTTGKQWMPKIFGKTAKNIVMII